MNHRAVFVLISSVAACESERFSESTASRTTAASSAPISSGFSSTDTATSGGPARPQDARADDASVGVESSREPEADATPSTAATSAVAPTSSGSASSVESAPSVGAVRSGDSDPGNDAGGWGATEDAVTEERDADRAAYAAGFHELYLHDACTDNTPGDDVCAHARAHEVPFTFGGDPDRTYDVKLRIRGLFEPTKISGGTTPYADHPYFKLGGTVAKADYSQWQIRIGEPSATFYLNHYSETGHVIYLEDFEVTLPIRGGADVVVGVVDANDRQVDNGHPRPPARSKVIEGVTDGIVDGQVLRIDVLSVAVTM